jgi:hypothetical protein
MKDLLLVLFVGLILISCEENLEIDPPENLISEATYIDLYVELHLFNALVEAVDTVMNQDSLMNELYEKYSVSEQSFRESHSFYQSQTQQQQVRLDTASARLARTLEALNAPRIIQPNQLGGSIQDSRPQN